MEMKKLLIFGTGHFADVVSYVLTEKMGRKVEAYTIHGKYLSNACYQNYSKFAGREEVHSASYRGRPVEAFERLEERYPKEEYEVVIGTIGKQMFNQREEIFRQVKQMGYDIPNVIDPTVSIDTEQIGEGNIILANSSIEAHCIIGEGNIIWQNVVLPHHNHVGNFNNLAPSVSLSGYSKIGNHCFVGNNVCIKNRTELSDYVFVGAGSYVSKSVAPNKVIVPYRSYELPEKTGFDFL